jgi:2-methylcitrate dehydratase PrpD
MLDNLPATSTPARTLGEFACGLTFEHIPAAVLERAKLLILDALGCGIASNAYGFSDAALAGATALGGVGRCSVIGRARSCSPASEDAWGSSVLPSGFRSNASAGMVV